MGRYISSSCCSGIIATLLIILTAHSILATAASVDPTLATTIVRIEAGQFQLPHLDNYTTVPIVYDYIESDKGQNWNKDTYTAPLSGYYQVQVNMNTNSTFEANMWLNTVVQCSSGAVFFRLVYNYGDHPQFLSNMVSGIVEMSAGNTLQVQVNHGSMNTQALSAPIDTGGFSGNRLYISFLHA